MVFCNTGLAVYPVTISYSLYTFLSQVIGIKVLDSPSEDHICIVDCDPVRAKFKSNLNKKSTQLLRSVDGGANT